MYTYPVCATIFRKDLKITLCVIFSSWYFQYLWAIIPMLYMQDLKYIIDLLKEWDLDKQTKRIRTFEVWFFSKQLFMLESCIMYIEIILPHILLVWQSKLGLKPVQFGLVHEGFWVNRVKPVRRKHGTGTDFREVISDPPVQFGSMVGSVTHITYIHRFTNKN